MSGLSVAIVIVAYVFILFALMAAPVGRRSFEISVLVGAPREKIWQAVWPLGRDAGWSGKIIGATTEGDDGARLRFAWDGRDGNPIERSVRFSDVEPGRRFAMVVTDDSALSQKFWRSHREAIELVDEPCGTRVTFRQSDRYRGLAFLLFRYFVTRREAVKLKQWVETGVFVPGGLIEHPLMQIVFAVISALMLWPLFGATKVGLLLATALTMVVAFHELGHMAAFRMMGHRSARMIFIPLIGGVAIGGRPYDSRFEVAFSAMMGAGFSAFLTPIVIGVAEWGRSSGYPYMALALTAFVASSALFNLANLIPVSRFDGGQVLRQVCPGPISMGVSSFAMLAAFFALGWTAGFPVKMLIIGGAVLSVLSIVTYAGNRVVPKTALKPISSGERWAAALGLVAIFVIHGMGALWAAERVMLAG